MLGPSVEGIGHSGLYSPATPVHSTPSLPGSDALDSCGLFVLAALTWLPGLASADTFYADLDRDGRPDIITIQVIPTPGLARLVVRVRTPRCCFRPGGPSRMWRRRMSTATVASISSRPTRRRGCTSGTARRAAGSVRPVRATCRATPACRATGPLTNAARRCPWRRRSTRVRLRRSTRRIRHVLRHSTPRASRSRPSHLSITSLNARPPQPRGPPLG